jgi:hypothetical protein
MMATQTRTASLSPATETGSSVGPSYRIPSIPQNRSPFWPKRTWRSKHVLGSVRTASESRERLSYETDRRSRSRTAAESLKRGRWWHVRLFRGMINDIRRRAPFYLSDWTDAWTYRVVPSTGVFLFFFQYPRRVAPIGADNDGV